MWMNILELNRGDSFQLRGVAVCGPVVAIATARDNKRVERIWKKRHLDIQLAAHED
jgi:hypothetical protein